MTAFLTDDDLNGNIIEALREVEPSIDLVTAKEAGLMAHPDAELLAWAATHGRVVVSHDVNTMIKAAYERVRNLASMPGLIIVPQEFAIGEAIDGLVLIAHCGEPADLADQARFFQSI